MFPEGLERATYVHASNLTLWPVLLFWQPIPIVLVDLSSVRPLMMGIYWVGWLIVLLSSLNIDLLELWGLRQAWSWSRGEVYEPPPFKESWLYRQVRHPIYLGLLIAFWATPQLTVGHALFAGCMSAYIFIGAWFEERDLVRKHGESYRDYQRKVPAYLLAWPCAGSATHVMSWVMADEAEQHEKLAIRGSAPPSGRRAAGQPGQAQGAGARPRRRRGVRRCTRARIIRTKETAERFFACLVA